MTNEEIISNNRLIAEFMGAKHKKDMPSLSRAYMDGNNYIWIPIHGIVRKDTISIGKGPIMKFHSSWNWLMPVVEKIEGIKDDQGYLTKVKIWVNRCDIVFGNDVKHFPYKLGETKIEATYTAVIEFIKWYNDNN